MTWMGLNIASWNDNLCFGLENQKVSSSCHQYLHHHIWWKHTKSLVSILLTKYVTNKHVVRCTKWCTGKTGSVTTSSAYKINTYTCSTLIIRQIQKQCFIHFETKCYTNVSQLAYAKQTTMSIKKDHVNRVRMNCLMEWEFSRKHQSLMIESLQII